MGARWRKLDWAAAGISVSSWTAQTLGSARLSACSTKRVSWRARRTSFTREQSDRAMPDVFTKAKRSEVMSRIRGRGNKDTELVLAKLFRAQRIIGWRRHTALLGKPDFAFRKERLVIFVDGCFWHQCPKHSNLPASNAAFWLKKLMGNKTRDRLVAQALQRKGWHVLRVWEHELRKPSRVLLRIRSALAKAAQRG